MNTAEKIRAKKARSLLIAAHNAAIKGQKIARRLEANRLDVKKRQSEAHGVAAEAVFYDSTRGRHVPRPIKKEGKARVASAAATEERSSLRQGILDSAVRYNGTEYHAKQREEEFSSLRLN